MASGLCTRKWQQPVFDGSDCDSFGTAGQAADEGHPQPPQAEPAAATGRMNRPFAKRGMSARHRNAQVESKRKTLDPFRSIAEKGFVLEIPEVVLRIAGWLLLAVALLFAVWGVVKYVENKREEARENIVWEARKLLENVTDARLINYLRLEEVSYENGCLVLTYQHNPIPGRGTEVSDPTLLAKFLSVVAMSPDRWQKAFGHLKEAGADLEVVFGNVVRRPSVRISQEKMDELFSQPEALRRYLQVFEQLKCAEIKWYADMHFKNDVLFTVDSVHIDKHFVTLCLSYDDKKARLSDAILDSTRVYPLFTDPVGDMGSILDGMWTVCSRTSRGFAFEFMAKRSRRKDRVSWSTDRAAAAYEKYNSGLWYDGKPTNQVRTVIRRSSE